MKSRSIWRRHYALPAEHGAWIWWVGPLLIGAAAGGSPSPLLGLLALTALAGFLLRQPATIIVKALSGRRARADLRPALIWATIYSILAIVGAGLLVLTGQARLLLLAIPGVLIFGWHLWQVSRREERQRPGVEIFAAGALSLTAPAGYWVSGGTFGLEAGLLWALTWLQSAASIVHVHLRLEQRHLVEAPSLEGRLRMGRRTLIYSGFNLAVSGVAAIAAWVPTLVPAAFGLTFVDTVDGVFRPAHGLRPRRIGVRQLVISSGFVAIMIAAYLI